MLQRSLQELNLNQSTVEVDLVVDLVVEHLIQVVLLRKANVRQIRHVLTQKV